MRRKIEGGVGALRESDDTNFLNPNGQSRNLNIYAFVLCVHMSIFCWWGRNPPTVPQEFKKKYANCQVNDMCALRPYEYVVSVGQGCLLGRALGRN